MFLCWDTKKAGIRKKVGIRKSGVMEKGVCLFFVCLLWSPLFSLAKEKVQVDLKGSQFTWKANKKIGSGHFGFISLGSAQVEMDKGLVTSGEFEMDLTSVTVTDLEGEWREKFLNHIKGGDFFDVEKFPTAKLSLEKQTQKGIVNGQLKIKDKTHPVRVRFNESKGVYEGTLAFDRTKFGITYNSENFFKVAADKIIEDQVTLEFKIKVSSKTNEKPEKKQVKG